MAKLIARTILILALVAGTALFGSAVFAADDSPRLLWGNQGRMSIGSVFDKDPLESAEGDKAAKDLANAFDTLRGNDSPSGYMLTHGNVILDTLSVSVDGRRLVRNRDYFLDPVSGGLSFRESISSMQTIRATYRYSSGKAVARSFVGLPLLPTYFGGVSNATFLHAFHAADASAGLPFDVLTFGMNMDMDFGKAGLQSMLFMSDPKKGSTAFGLFDKSGGKKAPDAVSDKIVAQKASFDMGSSRVTLGYQDVGTNFAGFASLREQGTLPNDVIKQLEREKGVRRLSAALELKPSSLMPEGSPWNRFSWMRMYDSTGAMDSFHLTYSTPKAGITGAFRTVDQSFTRIASLSTDELSQIALSTRLQFDANATAGQVTDADRKAVAQENGISRNLINSYMKFSPDLTGTLAFVNLSDGQGSVSRQTFSMAAKNWQGWIASQAVSSDFRKLNALAPVEKSHFGNEYGTHKLEGGLSARIAGKYSLTGDYSRLLSDTGGVLKTGLGLSGKYVNFKLNHQSIDPTFSRIADLADAGKKNMVPDRGYSRWDMSLGGQLSQALKVDTAFLRADNATENLSRLSDTINLMYSPSDKTKLSLKHSKASSDSAGEVISGAMRDIFSFEQRLKNNWFFSTSRDSNLTQAGGGAVAGTVTSVNHFETDKSKRSWFSYDERRMDARTGAFEYSTGYSVQTKLGQRLTLTGAQTSMDRGKDPSEDVSRIGIAWAVAKGLNFDLDAYTKQTNYAGDGSGYLSTLKGQVAERLGPLQKVTLGANYGTSHLSEIQRTFTRGITLDAVWGKSVVGLEYSHLLLASGKHHLARGYRFKSDPDKNKWYHLDLFLKDKDLGWGEMKPVRNIAADIRLNPTTQLAYVLNQNKELPNGTIELAYTRSTKLTTRLAGTLNLVLDSRREENFKAKTGVVKNSIGLQRQAASGMVVDVYYGRDTTQTATGSARGHAYRVKLDQQISADRFISLSAEMTHWDKTGGAATSRTTGEARLDFRMPMSL